MEDWGIEKAIVVHSEGYVLPFADDCSVNRVRIEALRKDGDIYGLIGGKRTIKKV
ncbi:MAG: hypothetical protein IJ733_07010 [Lachnospiraceae bacterium]|nr:hypothetical protein [Lachnospiraceae bacterium]